MAEFSFPFSGTTIGDAGPYSASFFASIFQEIFAQITRTHAGVLQNRTNGVNPSLWVTQTSPASAAVEIKIGSAIVQGYYYKNDATKNLPIAANTNGSGWNRIDTVALIIDFTNQTVRSGIVQGTPAASPVAPTLTQNTSIWQIRITDVTVPNLFVTIVDGNINNDVRKYAQLLDWREGGTGQSTYNVRDKFMGLSDGSLAIVKLSACSIENRNDPSSDLASGSFQKLQIQEKNDPDGLISVASDVITFAKAGWYTMTGFHADYTGITTTSTLYFRLRDTLSNTTLWVSDTFPTPSGQTNRDFLGSASFNIASDNTTVEFQVFRGAGTTRFESSAANPGGGETEKTIQADFIRWG